MVYINLEGVRVDKTEEEFEGIENEVVRLKQKGFRVILMGHFNAHIGLERSNHQMVKGW